MISHGFWRVLLTGTLAVSAINIALPAASAHAATSSQSDEYSFQWLDPDKKIYVLQNRKYEKANRLLFTLMGGPARANAYRTTLSVDSRVGYYFSEMFGVEAFYSIARNSENSTYKALKQASGAAATPIIREPDMQYGLLAHYVPWYAKINVFNNILYFDWYFSGGAGRTHSTLIEETGSSTTTSQEQLTTFFLGTGHQYHLSRRFTVRIDMTASFYQAPIFGTSGENTWFKNFNFNFGLGLRL